MLGAGDHVSLTPNVLIFRGTGSSLWYVPERECLLLTDDFVIIGG